MEYPKEWKVKSFEQLFEFKNGVNSDKSSYGEGGVKFINVMEIIYHDYITFDMIPGAVKIREDQKELYSVKNGDILFNRTSETTNEIGLSAVYNGNGEVTFGGFVIRGRPKSNEINDDFKRYCFRSDYVRKQIIVRGQGAVRSNIGQADLSSVKVAIPPMIEQQKIATILIKWDELIESQTRLIKAKEKQKTSLMQKLLTGEVRFPGFEEEWKEYTLSDIATITTGSSNREDSSLDGEYTFFDRSQDIRTSSRYLFDKEAVIVPGEGQAFIPKYFEGKFDLHQRTYAIFDFKGVDGKFLYYFICKNDKHLLSQAVGSTVKSLRLPMFEEMPVLVPSIKEQKKIASILSSCESELQSLKDELDALKLQKKGLMQQLLTGKIRVKV